MKQKIPTNVGTAILVIIAITTGMFVWQYEKNNNQKVAQLAGDENDWSKSIKNEGGKFISKDRKISFEYASDIRLKREDDKVTFWIVGDAGGDIGEVATYGFSFIENRQGSIGELYKENIFYKSNQKYFKGQENISIAGVPSVQYNFCDIDNCTDKDMIHEIFLQYDNTIYSFEFGANKSVLQQEILDSIKFN